MESKKKALEIAGWALEKQARKVVIVNIQKLSAVSDYLLICGADSERQVQAISYAIEDGLKKKGERALGVEGVTEGRWALMDYNDVVVHIFLEPVRTFYDLEGLWAEAPMTEVKDKVKKAVSGGKPVAIKARAEKPGAIKARAKPKARAKKTGAES
ncbi:MAG: ribosome silencing factor [Deltaproteobacteria bacterium]|nr:ribosome silencing factor [Deltaproteobacteria bacterium]